MVGQWGLLLPASVALAALLELTGLPAALLLGPMVAGILIGTNGGTIRAPRWPVVAAQTIVGCLVGRAVTGDIVLAFLRDWPLFLSVILVMLATSAALGWGLARYKVLPGSTAVWGTAPGGASVMMVMSASFHADPRLVAFMQYSRVVLVAALASVVARLWVGSPGAAAHAVVWFPPFPWLGFAATLLIAGLGGALGIVLRIPAGALLVPMVVGALLEGFGLVAITLPPWLLAISYALLGWSIGLGFTLDILAHAWRALPYVLLSIVVLVAVSVGLAAVLVHAAGIDPLTAYLATSPGGIDTVAIIAASSSANLSFVMAMQTVRLVFVLAAGPPLARFLARRTG
jgi:membrane AbrB-like protein